MTTDDIRTEAEALRLQLTAGLALPADVIAWADRTIEAEEKPHISIIELALAGEESVARLMWRLQDIPGEACVSDAIRILLRGMLDALDRGRNPETVARRLCTLAQAVNWPEEEFGTEPYWLDELFHSEMGVPFQEAVARLREYLISYAASNEGNIPPQAPYQLATMNNATPVERSLEVQRAEFASRRLIAMPIAGTIAWLLVGVAGLVFANPWRLALTLFIATGSIIYLGLGISRLTGENLLDRSRPKNVFDRLFFYGVIQAILVYAIAIPFFLRDYTSLPLTVGILTGLMWMPLSWIIEHWVGLFHSIGRTLIVLAVWLAFPKERYVAVPFAIVVIYLITIVVLERRWRGVRSSAHDAMRLAM